MPKARQVAGGLVIAGIALMMQGCWEDEQDRLILLGEGGCRTADGSEGAYITISAVSFNQCEAKCFDVNGQCTALEYNTNNSNCEIHSAPITSFEEVTGVSCYQRERSSGPGGAQR